jgi:hypothetical protein
MADRLTLTRALEATGMASGAAERVATEIYDAIHDNVATNTELQRVEAVLRAELHALEQRIDARFEALEQRIDARFAATEQPFAIMEQGLELRFEKVGRDIDRVVVRLVAAIAAGAVILFGALHYWPPHG